MEAGQKRLRYHQRADKYSKLEAAGFKNAQDLDDDALAVNLFLAEQVNAIPEQKKSYRCGICGGEHKLGVRCDKSAGAMNRQLGDFK